jgi:hypothetical protein
MPSRQDFESRLISGLRLLDRIDYKNWRIFDQIQTLKFGHRIVNFRREYLAAPSTVLDHSGFLVKVWGQPSETK